MIITSLIKAIRLQAIQATDMATTRRSHTHEVNYNAKIV